MKHCGEKNSSRNWKALLPSAIVVCLLSISLTSVAQTIALVGPLRMADSPLGLVVADYVGRQVVIVDPTTLEITDAVPIYTDDTLLDRGKPLSVGWMNGRLYVGEERTGLIQVFEKTGGKKNPGNKNPKKQAKWIQVSPSLTTAALGQPSAMAADESQGLLFVASKLEKAVLVFDADGNLLRTIGEEGSAAPLGKPQGIALDLSGERIYVSDDGFEVCTWMGCTPGSVIQVYDYSGQSLGSINGDGSSGLSFSRVQGVAVDDSGRVFMADSYRNEVLVFEEGSPNSWSAVGTLGTRGTGPGQLLLPTGVFSDSVGSRILVANTMVGRIEVFATGELAQ